MNIRTNIATSHSLELVDGEAFDVTTKTKRPATIRVHLVIAEQLSQGGEWHIRAVGKRILKSGAVGGGMKLDTWTYTESFRQSAQVELFHEFPQAVQEALALVGVTV